MLFNRVLLSDNRTDLFYCQLTERNEKKTRIDLIKMFAICATDETHILLAIVAVILLTKKKIEIEKKNRIREEGKKSEKDA
jgi:hypothetical protein